MTFPAFEDSFPSVFLQTLHTEGFTSYFKAPTSRFFELLGLGLLEHAFDPSFMPSDHLSAYYSLTDPVQQLMPLVRSLPKSDDLWATFRSAVISTIKSYCSGTTYNFQCYEAGAVPEPSNAHQMEMIATALGVCIVYFERIEGVMYTQYFVTPQEHVWVFFVYMGKDGETLYCLRRQEIVDHLSAVSCQYKAGTRFAPMLVGREWPGSGFNGADEACARLFATILDCVAGLAGTQVSEMTGNNVKEWLRAWNSVKTDLESTHFPAVLHIPAIKPALEAILLSEKPKIDDIPPPKPHKLAYCDRYPTSNDEYLVHECGVRFHRECLKRHIREGKGVVRCVRCPRAFTEEFSERVWEGR